MTLTCNSDGDICQKASILFIDMPVGTGFSYARTPQGLKKGDLVQVQQNHQFLRKVHILHAHINTQAP